MEYFRCLMINYMNLKWNNIRLNGKCPEASHRTNRTLALFFDIEEKEGA